ncbi:MAG: hypothetical protein R2838_10495 [Caldilineaceae bacterium]
MGWKVASASVQPDDEVEHGVDHLVGQRAQVVDTKFGNQFVVGDGLGAIGSEIQRAFSERKGLLVAALRKTPVNWSMIEMSLKPKGYTSV